MRKLCFSQCPGYSSRSIPIPPMMTKAVSTYTCATLERMASTCHMSHGEDLFALLHVVHIKPVDHKVCYTRNVVETIKLTTLNAFVNLWIFLQFVVVICMFLYMMTNCGPREGLSTPPQCTVLLLPLSFQANRSHTL